MKRKIIKQGHNALTLTLPSDWTKRFNLEAGCEVDVEEKDNGLFVSTEKNDRIRSAEFDITGMDIPTVWKYFMAVYREGYDEVRIHFDPAMELESPYKFFTHHRLDVRYKKTAEKRPIVEVLQGFVARFIGYEIVEHGKNFILIKEMGTITGKEFDNSLRRIFLLLEQMAEEAMEAVKTNNPRPLIHIHDVDINLDKFHDYCVRILNKTGNKDMRKTSLLFTTLYLLELAGDEFKNIASHMVNDFAKIKLNNIKQLAEYAKQEVDLYYALFYKYDVAKVQLMSELDKKSYMLFPQVYKKASEDEKEIFHHFRMIVRYINALLELRIEIEF